MDATATRLKHADLLYDYIKFHLALYIATPTALGLLASALARTDDASFKHGLVAMLCTYFLAAVHASWAVASRINTKWSSSEDWLAFGDEAHSLKRRRIHHYLYWFGLGLGLLGFAGLLP